MDGKSRLAFRIYWLVIGPFSALIRRRRLRADRDLAALTHRRDSINAQLSNVREMLATLTGAAAPGANPATVAAIARPDRPAPTPTGRSSTRV